MKKPNRSGIITALVAAGLVLTGTTSLAAERFTGRILTGGDALSSSVINFKVSIEKYSNPEEILELVRVLNEKGYPPFMKAFRGMNNGTFQSTGGPGLGFNVTIHATNSLMSDKGRRVQLFSERQNWDMPQDIPGMAFFLMVELDIDAEGRGTGRIYTAAEIQFNSEGKIEMKSYALAPWVIFNVRRTN